MAALQRGFSGLADAVLEELDALHAREAAWQRERASVAGLAAEVRRKLSGALSPAEAADLRDRCAQLELRLSAATATAEGARAEARRACDAQAARMDALQAQAAQADGLLASEVAAARADVAALHSWALEVERSHGARLAQAESGLRAAAAAREADAAAAAAATAAAASAAAAAAAAVEQLGARLANHARRTEAVLSELETSTTAAAETAGRAERGAAAAAAASGEQHESLCRATAVFADALQIPAPVVVSPSLLHSLAAVRAASPTRNTPARSRSPVRGGADGADYY